MPATRIRPCRQKHPRQRGACLLALVAGVLATALVPASAFAGGPQATQLISRAMNGGFPNGPSFNGVISGDRRWARVIAFESWASNLVPGDRNGLGDVFAIRRSGRFGNDGSPWRPGRTVLVSRGLGGRGANGPSWGASVDGGFTDPASCVAFISAASNLGRGDTNGKTDAFVSRGPGRPPKRISKLMGRQTTQNTTEVAVNGNCKRIAFVTGGSFTCGVGRTVRSLGPGRDPSWSVGKSSQSDLVYTGPGGVRLSKGGTSAGMLVAPGGRNPSYNNIKRNVLAYEVTRGARIQVVWKDLGQRSTRRERLPRDRGQCQLAQSGGRQRRLLHRLRVPGLQPADRRQRSAKDSNGAPDVYLWTDVRDITLLQSVRYKGVAMPNGARKPSMSFYANYILWDAPSPLGSRGPHQVYMRWLGPV